MMPTMNKRVAVCGLGGGAFVVGLCTMAGVCAAKAPPAPGENPKRDVIAIKAAQAEAGLLRLPTVSSDAEVQHNRRFDEVIAPVRNTGLSVAEAEVLRAAKKAAAAKLFDEALAAKSQLKGAVAKKLVDWLVLRQGGGSISQYHSFLKDNPYWPNRWLLIEHLEEKLLKLDDPRETLAAFETLKPESVVGEVALARALAKTSQRKKAVEVAKKAWRRGEIPKSQEKEYAALLGDLIDPNDHAARKKAKASSQDAKWGKTRSKSYDAMKAKKFKRALQIITGPTRLSVNPRKQQAFLAGWISLRYLGDKKAAIKYFTKMRKDADGPLSRSKSAYWLGRAYEAAGDRVTAEKHYRDAFAKQIDTFHALLARQRLKPGSREIDIQPPKAPSAEQVERFQQLDAAKAVVIADKAGLGRSITRPFLANLGNLLDSEAEVALVAHLSRALGDTQQSLRIGKAGIGRGMNLIYYAYPLHAFPEYKPLREPPEPAFLLAIARQESEFNTSIVSSAGARGILQVMPITARHVCRDYKIRCQIKRLLTDESYNTKISSAYIADRMEEFRGSYVLGLSGYNAGPGRTRQWIRQIGDPRDGRIDEIDWIERIPFYETRSYVAKVLSNIQMYRARLGEAGPLRLENDLMRAKETRKAGKRHAPGSKALQVSSGR